MNYRLGFNIFLLLFSLFFSNFLLADKNGLMTHRFEHSNNDISIASSTNVMKKENRGIVTDNIDLKKSKKLSNNENSSDIIKSGLIYVNRLIKLEKRMRNVLKGSIGHLFNINKLKK